MKSLTHYRSAAITHNVLRATTAQRAYYKPRGLWVSVDGEDDWREWCIAEDFRLNNLRVPHKVTLSPEATILYLCSYYDIVDFTNDLSIIPEWHKEMGRQPDPKMDCIDWPRVAAEYDGIIIAPYIWRARLEYMWYYGWDCASGCIWNTAAIENMEPCFASTIPLLPAPSPAMLRHHPQEQDAA